MPPKPKPKPKPSKRHAHAPASSPAETADDHLAHCIFLEESGDKWRAGDAGKAARFYVRALQGYDEGLVRWPGGGRFDMAYNKARIQYHITQYPAVSAQFPLPLLQQLRAALASHRYALQLDPSNSDVLFNTAQVLTSLAEAVQDEDSGTDYATDETNSILGEAVSLFQQCLTLQEASYDQNMQQISEAQDLENDGMAEEMTDSPAGQSIKPSVEEERWASIVEPVTKQSLLDTALALLDTLGAWSMALSVQDQPGLNHVESIGQDLLANKLQIYLDGVEEEARRLTWLTVIKFKATVSEAEFKQGRIDVQTYDLRLKEAIEIGPTNDGLSALTATSEFLCCYADTLIAFSAAVAPHPDTAVLRWSRLSKALDCLTQASKIPRVDNLATLHVGRGDVELLRHVLCITTDLPDNLSNGKVQATLLKNAETYYRGAFSLAQSSMRRSPNDVYVTASIKRAVIASMIGGSNEPLFQLRASGTPDSSIKTILQDMIDESLVLAERIQVLLV